jgi:uncharacterized protein
MKGILLLSVMLLASCAKPPEKGPPMPHLVHYFEIPVTDLDRASAYYEQVLGIELERSVVDGYEMALFPYAEGQPGASGALAKGDVYVPSRNGAIIYFAVADIDSALARARAAGSMVLYPKKDVGDAGYVAEVEDSEGNRLAFSQPRKETK